MTMSKNVTNFDVCIIGGSIAGNFLGYLLSNTNLRIVIIEEHKEVGLPFQCAGIVSQKLSKLIDLPNNLILNRVKVAKIIGPSGSFIKLSGNENPYIIDRIGLDCVFYNRIINKQNITYLLGEKFLSFNYIKHNHQKIVLVKTSKRKLKAKMLIGCDGPLSSVIKTFGIKNKNIYAIQLRLKENFDENEVVMYFDHRWKELFGWIVPEGNNVYRIGIASSKNTSKNFRLFLKKMNINLDQIINQQGGLIPYGLMNKLAFDNVLLVGDSAGQVKATTGGGIIMLLTAAKYAANCIKKCFKDNKFSRKQIKKYYEKPCKLQIGKELKIHYIIRAFLEKFTYKDFEKVFQIIKTSEIENLISVYGDMDFPKTLIFKIFKNPWFFPFVIKFLLKNPTLLIKALYIIKL